MVVVSGETTRQYQSPLRERRARETRERILDALTELLEGAGPDDITTREIARVAGVSQPTVYRHFPDRDALLAGLVDRLDELSARVGHHANASSLDEWAARIESMFVSSDLHPAAAKAEALLNADPRRFAEQTRERSQLVRSLVETELDELDATDRASVAALLRCLGSAQTWLRMREEFGVSGTVSGPVVAWAIRTLAREAAAAGTMPSTESTG